MANLVRSPAALSVYSKFMRKKATLFVEGKTDKSFWQSIFECFSIKNIDISIAGDCNVIDEYIDNILDGKVSNTYVARDRDYIYLHENNTVATCNNILFSYGHSMENSLATPCVIEQVILNGCGSQESDDINSEIWLSKLSERLRPFVVLEIANSHFKKGVKILGDNCDRFLISSKNYELCDKKLAVYYDEKKSRFEEKELELARKIMEESGLSVIDIVRGHFMISVMMRYVKFMIARLDGVKPPTMDEAIFVSALKISMQNQMLMRQHPHYGFFNTQVQKLSA